MKIFGKRYNNLFSIFLGGKPSTVKTTSKEEADQLTETLRKASEGDEEAISDIKKRVEKPKEERIEEVSIIKDLKDQESTIKEKLESATESRKLMPDLSVVEKDERFVVTENENGSKSYSFKNYQAELPIVFVEKIALLLQEGKEISHLEKFWQLTLLNDNPQARRDLYKYLTKQKMIITKEGYFVTFRSIVKVDDHTVMRNSNLVLQEKDLILEMAAKVKRWRKSLRSFEVYRENNGDKSTLLLKPIKDHKKNSLKYYSQGLLFDLVESIKVLEEKEESVETFTDDYTRTMVIKIGKPVRMDRSKCNSDPKVECSYGLHVGTPSFVGSSDCFGKVKVACLVNPMHVVSVPYRDAHKMRVCEYLPFKIITVEELKEFDSLDIDVYEQAYKEIENKKLEKALSVIDSLTDQERETFVVDRQISSLEDINELMLELEEKKKTIKSEISKLDSLLDDDVSKTLSIDEVKLILQNRLK